MRRTALSREIIVALSFLTGAALLLMGSVLTVLTRDELVNQKIVESVKQARNLSQMLVTPLHGIKLVRQPSTNINIPDLATDYTLRIYDSNLVPLKKHPLQAQPLPPLSPSAKNSVRFAQDPLVEATVPPFWPWLKTQGLATAQIISPIVDKSRFLGVLQLSLPFDDVATRVQNATLLALGYVLLFGFLIVASGYYLLRQSIVRPVHHLVKATQSIAAGQLDVETYANDAPDEIFILAHSFEEMVTALQKSHKNTAEQIQSLKEANETLRETRRELVFAEKMASVGHLAAGMAHEVGNPLGAMIGYLNYLLQELDTPEHKDLLKRTLAEASRIDHLVRDLLDFAAAQPSHGHQCDASQVAQEALDFLTRQGKFNGYDLLTEFEQGLPLIAIDNHRLMQVLVNLLLNACDASVPGNQIKLSSTKDATGVALMVADSGTGISEKDMSHIFDPFFSTKPEGKGRGLGLAICHRIITEAGGTITATAKKDRGTLFTLNIPTVKFSQ